MKFQASGTVAVDLPGITRGSPSRPERAQASRAAGLTGSASDPPVRPRSLKISGCGVLTRLKRQILKHAIMMLR